MLFNKQRRIFAFIFEKSNLVIDIKFNFSMEKLTVKANKRTNIGSTAAKSSRNKGMVPGVVYGGKEIYHIEVMPADIKLAIHTADFRVITLDLDGKTIDCVIKSSQFHPISDALEHFDLLELVAGQPIRIEIPLRFKGKSPGVKVGGKFVQKLRKIKIKTTPENLVNELYADISTMELGQSIRVRDISVPKGIEISNPPAIPVATIEIPRALRNQA